MKIGRSFALIPLLVYPFTCNFAVDAQRTMIQNRGSDSMAIAVVEWAEKYRRENKATGIAISGGGTGTGIAALLNGTVDIANASRAMNRREINLAKAQGSTCTAHRWL